MRAIYSDRFTDSLVITPFSARLYFAFVNKWYRVKISSTISLANEFFEGKLGDENETMEGEEMHSQAIHVRGRDTSITGFEICGSCEKETRTYR